MATLKDVAREAGFGLGTVSRALSGHPSVLPTTRRRVQEVAKELGYQPNELARALRNRSSRAIGLVVPDLENDFYTSGAAEIQEILAEQDYRLILCCSNNDPAIDAALLLSLVERRVDAIAHVPCSPEGSDVIRESNPLLPIVEYARRSASRRVDSIVGDEELGSRLLIEHLTELGHTRIAMIAGPREQSTTAARVTGFETAVRLSGLDPEECPVMYGNYDPQWGEEAMLEILDSIPDITAVFASNSTIVLGALRAISARGLSVPADMSLVSFLNPLWFEVASAPITTYELPLRDMGAMVADLLLHRIRASESDQLTAEPRAVRLEGRLIVRESTAPPRTRPIGK